MNVGSFTDIAEVLRHNPVLRKLELMAQRHLGGSLHILLCRDNKADRLLVDGSEGSLPRFCQLIRASEDGSRRCSVCRYLTAIRACRDDVGDFSCHGGISVVAAAALKPGNHTGAFLVVTSCGFADENVDAGWCAAQKHASDLPVNMKALKIAFYALPRLDRARVALAKDIVDAAASVLSHSTSASEGLDNAIPAYAVWQEEKLDATLSDAFSHAEEQATGPNGAPTGSALVDVVSAIVSQNPALPFSVANVSRAARVTPNHFSKVFSQYAGKTFSTFLTEKRIDLAHDLLADLHLSVNDVANLTGFPDAAYFSRRFKAVTGQSPSQYRAKL